MLRPLPAATVVIVLVAIGCNRSAPPPTAAPVASAPTSPGYSNHADSTAVPEIAKDVPRKLETEHLPNAYRITATVMSGGLPEGDEAFQELSDLGVKTIISVDGMKPDVETARRHGLRYVHLPHGYDGIPEERAEELAKAVRELPGPVYIHCHHGKHRSPTAAAVACVGAGLIEPSLAVTILRTAGTSENYRGLYASAEHAHPFDQALLDSLNSSFPEVSAVPPLADAMVALHHTHDHLKLFASAAWKSLPGHPDLDPAHEALLLREHFRELQRLDDVTRRSEEFQNSLHAGEDAAQRLEDALRAAPVDPASATQALELVDRHCTECHRRFRDPPLQDRAR